MENKMKPFAHEVASTMNQKARTIEFAPSEGNTMFQHLDENGNTTHFTVERDGRAEPIPVPKQSKLSKLTQAIKHMLPK